MLDPYAWKLLNAGDGLQLVIGIGLVGFGFALGMLGLRDRAPPIARVPYLLMVGASSAALVAVSLLWALAPEAILHWLLWLLVLSIYLTLVLDGVVLAWAAAGRARSAYGSGHKGWLALVPLVNLVLFLAAPAEAGAPPSVGRRALNVLGTVLGLGLLALGQALPHSAEGWIAAQAEQAAGRADIAEAVIELRLRAGDLPAVLRDLAAAVQETRLDEVTVLLRAESEANLLRYAYSIASWAEALDESFHAILAGEVCADHLMTRLLDAGAQVEFVYDYGPGKPESRFVIGIADCPAV